MQELQYKTASSARLYKTGLKRLPSWLKNKYLLTTVAFLVVLIFFDSNNFFLQYERWSRLRKLNSNEKHLITQIQKTSIERNMLKTSAETIEKYARENYLMKKDNEDLFVIQKDK